MDAKAIDAVEQVTSEAALFHRQVKRLMGCTYQCEIYSDRAPSQRRDFALLNYTQQSRLQHERHVANFIEKKCPSFGFSDTPWPTLLMRARIGAGCIPKQFRLDQRFGDRSTVDGHEGLASARSAFVDGPGEDFLSGAGLALNQ
ncbi:hypothetical protein U875_05335 [Pandoraea pnomenusa 3kgm]|nr:hypothetical protein U875_05335 [Pandoraea pnomenusa 3kgm]AHB78372.1 hypothetical protein X636_04265 [Pandoraea pnomenusa]AHN77614.1 hypothetical protein DA70_22405 [Pandoraea pnomenusa]